MSDQIQILDLQIRIPVGVVPAVALGPRPEAPRSLVARLVCLDRGAACYAFTLDRPVHERDTALIHNAFAAFGIGRPAPEPVPEADAPEPLVGSQIWYFAPEDIETGAKRISAHQLLALQRHADVEALRTSLGWHKGSAEILVLKPRS